MAMQCGEDIVKAMCQLVTNTSLDLSFRQVGVRPFMRCPWLQLLITVKPTPTSGTFALSKAAAQIGAYVSSSECKDSDFIDDAIPTLVQAALKV